MAQICRKPSDKTRQNNRGQSLKTEFFAKLVVLIAAPLFVYIPAIRSGFVWDDDSMLTDNAVLKENGLYQCWFTATQPNYWPITWTSYWLEHKLWGLKPAGYHITNILIHTACALLVWRVLLCLNVPAAFVAAVIFAVHPVNVESAAWVAQRKTVLSMLFFLLSLLFYLQFDLAGKRTTYILSVTLFIAAMLSKGSVVGLPVVILLCIWWLRRTITKRDILRTMPFFAVSAVMSAVEIWFQYNRAIGEDVIRSDSFFSRLAGAGWAIWFYFYKAVLPVNLTFIYPRWKIDPASWVSYVPGLLLIVLLALSWRYRRGWGRPVFFAVVYFVVMLLPVLGFFNIYFMRYSLVADHYQYVSIAAVISFVVAACYDIFSRFGQSGVKTAKAVAALVAVILAALSWCQSGIYRDIETLWSDTLKKDPGSWMAHNNLGNILQLQGRTDEAVGHFRQALRVKPDFAEAHYNLGYTLQQQGRIDEAEKSYRQALQFKPDFAKAHNNLGVACVYLGRHEEAVKAYRQAIKIKPDYANAHYNLGTALYSQGKVDEAVGYYRQAIAINPDYAEAHNNLGVAYFDLGRYEEAIKAYRQAIRIKPDYADAYYNLGRAFKAQGKSDEAVNNFRQVIKFKPDFAEVYNEIGGILLSRDRLDEAVGYYQQALKIKPNYAKVHYSLGAALQSKGNLNEALVHYRQALRDMPNSVEANNSLAWILATNPDPNMRDAKQAIELAERAAAISNHQDAIVLNTLAAAYAAAGRFDKAAATAQQALELARTDRNDSLVNQILERLERYRKAKP